VHRVALSDTVYTLVAAGLQDRIQTAVGIVLEHPVGQPHDLQPSCNESVVPGSVGFEIVATGMPTPAIGFDHETHSGTLASTLARAPLIVIPNSRVASGIRGSARTLSKRRSR